MTKAERRRLARAVELLREPDGWDEAMETLCRLLNPSWRPPEPGQGRDGADIPQWVVSACRACRGD